MAFSKYATFSSAQILDVKGAPTRLRTASLDKIADYHDYRTEDGYLYARIRAISSRVNRNNDGWPSIELAGSPEIFERHQSSHGGFTVEASEGKDMGFATFVGKPIFVDHHNSDPEHTRGAIVDAKLHVEDAKTAGKLDPYYASAPDNHNPPTWVELLLEIDAKSYPKFAKAIIDGSKDSKKGIDGFSMGCDVKHTICNICSNKAEAPDDFCEHVKLKGASFKDKKTGKMKKAYEDCYGIKFFEISGVFEPADETALIREVKSSVRTADNPLPQDDHIKAPEDVDTLREDKICPICGSNYDGHTCEVCGYVEPPDGLNNPDLEKAHGENPEQEGADGTEQSEQDEKVTELPNSEKGIPDDLSSDSPGDSYLKARNKGVTSSVINEMAWKASGYLESKRINKGERPLLAGNPPQSNEPAETIIKNPLKPTTARTAESFVAAAGATNKENNMANENRVAADAPAGTAADKRVDVTGVGGVIEDSNEAASRADAQVNVEGVGGTGVEGVAADEHQNVEKEVRTDDSGPTKTFPNKDQTNPVTSEVPTWVTDNKWSATNHVSGDDKTLEQQEQQGNPVAQGGGAAQGAQPADPSGKPDERVNLLDSVTSPENNSGKTKTWSGTDGNGVTKQQPGVTSVPTQFGGINSHVVAVFKLADKEVDMGIIEKSEKWERIAQLENATEGEVVAQIASLERVRTAGLTKNHEPVVGKVPSLRQAAVEEIKTASLDSELDSALFSR